MPNINITIDDGLHKRLKLKALMTDRSLKDLFIQTLDKRTRRR